MTLKELMPDKAYGRLKEIQEAYPILTFQNDGYEYLSKGSFSEEEENAFSEVSSTLKKYIVGFTNFNNFRHCKKTGELQVRIHYDYNEGAFPHFSGVGYFLLTELKNGFKDEEKN